MTKGKRTNNDLQNIAQKVKDRTTWTPLKTRGELRMGGQFLLNNLFSEKCCKYKMYI